jgi:hypothetical protein
LNSKVAKWAASFCRSSIDHRPSVRIVVLDVLSVVEHPQFRQLLWHADLVVPVFAAGRSTKESVRRHLQGIESVGKRAHGAILNRWRSIRPFWLPRSLDL